MADGVARLQIEEQGNAGELIDMIHRLRTQNRMPRCQGIQRDHARAVVALDVEQMEVLRLGALIVGNLENHLILVGRLLDQVNVVLRIR